MSTKMFGDVVAYELHFTSKKLYFGIITVHNETFFKTITQSYITCETFLGEPASGFLFL